MRGFFLPWSVVLVVAVGVLVIALVISLLKAGAPGIPSPLG